MEARDGVMIVGGNVEVFTKDVRIMTMGRRQEESKTPKAAAPTAPASSPDVQPAPSSVPETPAADSGSPANEDATPPKAQPNPLPEVSSCFRTVIMYTDAKHISAS
jgi:hypothetical protein